MDAPLPQYSLENPLCGAPASPAEEPKAPTVYESALELGQELLEKPELGGGPARVRVQHAKQRMTVFEGLKVLTDREPNMLWSNWGPALDGASSVTGILDIGGRDVAV